MALGLNDLIAPVLWLSHSWIGWIGAALFLLYVFLYVRTPVITCVANEQNKRILSDCGLLHRPYWPTFWLPNQLLQTACSNVYRTKPPGLTFERESFELKDGENSSIDWFRYSHSSDKLLANGGTGAGDGTVNSDTGLIVNALPPEAPIVLLLHGLAGSSEQPNTQYFIELCLRVRSHAAAAAGLRICVWNRRGSAPDVVLKYPKPYQWGNTDDLNEVVDRINARYPNAPLVAVGLSAGSNPLCKYLGETAHQSKIKAAVSISNCFDVEQCANLLVTRPFWDKTMGESLKEALFTRHRELYREKGPAGIDLDAVAKSLGVRELDRLLMCPLWGFKDVDEYHRVNSSNAELHRVSVPLLALNSMDDPIIPDSLLPYAVARSNDHVILATTHAGGHLGWIESHINPFSAATWVERVALEFLLAFLKNQKDVIVPTQAPTSAAEKKQQ